MVVVVEVYNTMSKWSFIVYDISNVYPSCLQKFTVFILCYLRRHSP